MLSRRRAGGRDWACDRRASAVPSEPTAEFGTVSFGLGASTLQKEVPAGTSSAIFSRVRLPRGAGRLESWVTQGDRRIGMLDVLITLRR